MLSSPLIKKWETLKMEEAMSRQEKTEEKDG